MSLFIFFMSLSVLILIHEWGHYYVARRSGVAVEEFGIGFPPRLFARKKGETVFSINLIPLGGFVRLRGEEDPSLPGSFMGKPVSIKIAVTIAGVAMNLVLAYFLIAGGYLIGLPDFDSHFSNVTVLQVLPDSPAARVGLQLGDHLISITTPDGRIPLHDPRALRAITEQHVGQRVMLEIERGNQHLMPTVTLQPSTAQRGPLGVAVSSLTLVREPFPRNFVAAGTRLWGLTGRTLEGFAGLVKTLLGERRLSNDVVGPLGIFNIFQQMKLLGLGYLLHFWALVSLNLALINLFPLPALDGGRILFNLIEAIARRPVPLQLEARIHQVGFVLLLALLLLVSVRDVRTFLVH